MAETGPSVFPRPYPTVLLGALWTIELVGFAVSVEWLRWLAASYSDFGAALGSLPNISASTGIICSGPTLSRSSSGLLVICEM